MIAAHVPIVTVAGRLGHAQTSTTTDIYAGFIRTADAAAADAIESVFDRIREKNHAKKNSAQEAVCRACALFCCLPILWGYCFVRYLCAIRPKCTKTRENGFELKRR